MGSKYRRGGRTHSHDFYQESRLENDVKKWLESLDLNFNPFDPQLLDAGADPRLPSYLVGHSAFATLWGDWPSFMFAPAGGGKSAFRVRLSHACRTGTDGRAVFPIIYTPPSPDALSQGSAELAVHFHFLSHVTAAELLLELAYQPWRYIEFDDETRYEVRRHLEANLPSSLEYFLAQLDEAESFFPLAYTFDPTATQLINPPGPDDIRQFCASLRELPPIEPPGETASTRFQQLVEFIRGPLGYEAIYLLIDGVDAYLETANDPERARALIDPFLEQMQTWASKHIFVKFFLPHELEPLLMPMLRSLTPHVKHVTINWTSEMLIDMLQERLRVASAGIFASFDAISTPSLYETENKLVQAAKPLPREVLVLAARLLAEHVRRIGPTGKLELADFQVAANWYSTQ